jgi:hypothetical protein
MPRICLVGIIQSESNPPAVAATTYDVARSLTSNIERRISNLIGRLVSVSITAPKQFPIRVAWKSVMILPRAKRGSYPHARGNFAIVHQIFFGAPRLTFSLFRCALVHPVQAAQRRMVGQRTIQLWMVRSRFFRLSFLAPLARSARAGGQWSVGKSQRQPSRVNRRIARSSRASLAFASPSF